MDWYAGLVWIVQSGGFRGMVSGTITAAIVDIGAFRGWKSWDDALTYNYQVASFRWGQGAFFGLLSGLGMSGFD